MPQRNIYRILILFALAPISAAIALAQSPTSPEIAAIPIGSSNAWQDAQSAGPARGKLFVVTVDQPHRRQTCRVRSFTLDKLVCSRAIGGSRTYLPEQVVALILPGDGSLRLPLFLGFNAGLGAAIWGTVVLAATCPACAVSTGIAALFFFCNAGVLAFVDDQPDRLLYLAPGHQLTGKLQFVRF